MAGHARPSTATLEAALTDFERSPGKHLVALRQPQVLFASLREILQIASGRGAVVSPPVRRAAHYFISHALLRPNTTHYALLGLLPDATAEEIKDRFRQMVRVLHPDFARGQAWPADAMARLNQAYEVLSAPERREAYDATLAPPVAQMGEAMGPTASAHGATGAPVDGQRVLGRLATAFGVMGVAGVLIWLLGSGEKEMLVQRQMARPSPSRADAMVVPSVQDIPAPAPLIAPPPSPAISHAFAVAEGSPTVAQVMPAPSSVGASVADLRFIPSAVARPMEMPAPVTPLAAGGAVQRVALLSSQPISTPPLAVAQAPVVTTAPAPLPATNASTAAVATRAPATPPTPTLAEVHQQLMQMVQLIETGRGERLLAFADRNVRSAASAQALAQHFNDLVDGSRPVQVATMDFHSEQRDGRLIVDGVFKLKLRDTLVPFTMQAEFALRDGAPVITRLARGQ